jgi:hypothetical protein
VWMFDKGGLKLGEDDVVRAPQQISLPLKALNIFLPLKRSVRYVRYVTWQQMVK